MTRKLLVRVVFGKTPDLHCRMYNHDFSLLLLSPFVHFFQGNALFIYLLEQELIRGLTRYVYWLVVSIGVVLNVYRLYKVLHCALQL